MKNKNEIIFKVLKIVSWIVFIGLCINAGVLTFNTILSFNNPHIKLNLMEGFGLKNGTFNDQYFYYLLSFPLVIAYLKAYLFYLVVLLINKIDIQNPFSEYAANKIENISYYTASIGFVASLGKGFIKEFIKRLDIENFNTQLFGADFQAYLLMGGVIYIISVIFRRGVELQSENDLTI